MSALTDLANVVSLLTEDVAANADEVKVAIDELKEAIAASSTAADNDPRVQAAVDALERAHENLSATTSDLKDEVDAVNASGGPAA